jgi:hypothetical protein
MKKAVKKKAVKKKAVKKKAAWLEKESARELEQYTKQVEHRRKVSMLIERFDDMLRDLSLSHDEVFHADRALWNLLHRWREELPALDDYFHKAFRQTDVTDDGYTDMAIYNLLHVSKRFWVAFEDVRGLSEKKKS